jgi:hypothetical protein
VPGQALRSRAADLTAALLVLAAAACVEVTPGANPQTPEAELARQARALQRTVLEAAAIGAVAGAGGAYVVGGHGEVPTGVFIGLPIGVAAGTYVGSLQQRYATNEARLERLRRDIDATNAETEATIRTMRQVLARQQSQLAAARAGGQPTPALADREQIARASLGDMRLAIDGATRREAEFDGTRALQLVPGERTGVDSQVADLGARIAEMRAIADTLAGDL